MNGNTIEDREVEYTFIGSKGSTVIDYVIVNDEIRDNDIFFEIQERVESDHLPLILQIKGEKKPEHTKQVEKERELIKEFIIWNDETIELFKKTRKNYAVK